MIYGDNPNKINEREDALGLKAYTYTPSISSIMQSGNLYVYCVNNPTLYQDTSGYIIDTVFDIVSLCFSIADVVSNPYDVMNWVGLAGDVVDLIPGVTGVGETVKAVKITSNIAEGTNAIKDAKRATEIVQESSKKIDFYVTPDGITFPAKKIEFENNLSKMKNKNGKYVSYDEEHPLRIRYNEVHIDKPDFPGAKNPDHAVPHFHFERRKNGARGEWKNVFTGRMEILL